MERFSWSRLLHWPCLGSRSIHCHLAGHPGPGWSRMPLARTTGTPLHKALTSLQPAILGLWGVRGPRERWQLSRPLRASLRNGTPSLLPFFLAKKLHWNEVKVAQSCPILYYPVDYTVHGILQARILKWIAFPFSRGSSQPRDRSQVSCIAGRFFINWAMHSQIANLFIYHLRQVRNYMKKKVKNNESCSAQFLRVSL